MAMDVRIWLDVDRKVARRRLIRRNLEAGVGKDLNETIRRGEWEKHGWIGAGRRGVFLKGIQRKKN